jgi:division protein CdvB (Snf7/Vps24/ESCRT-III family)
MENVYEEVKTHKKVKKHHGKNKGPKWFREFAERIEARLDKIEATLAEHGKRLDAIEARLEEHSKDIAEIKERLDRNNIF